MNRRRSGVGCSLGQRRRISVAARRGNSPELGPAQAAGRASGSTAIGWQSGGYEFQDCRNRRAIRQCAGDRLRLDLQATPRILNWLWWEAFTRSCKARKMGYIYRGHSTLHRRFPPLRCAAAGRKSQPSRKLSCVRLPVWSRRLSCWPWLAPRFAAVRRVASRAEDFGPIVKSGSGGSGRRTRIGRQKGRAAGRRKTSRSRTNGQDRSGAKKDDGSGDAKPQAGRDGEPSKPKPKYPPYAEVLKDAKKIEGLITLHRKDDQLFAEIGAGATRIAITSC